MPMTKRQLLFTAGLLTTAGLLVQYNHLLIINTGIFDLSQFKQPIKARRFDPFVNRWQRKFYANGRDGYLFFKHIRKAGGTTMRNYLAEVLKYHDNPRTVADFIRNVETGYINKQFLQDLHRVSNLGEGEWDLINNTIHTINNFTAPVEKAKGRNQIHYAEQEFTSMDWQCARLDKRWNDTLSVIMLRHPIERHLSEFFYSGPGSSLGLDAKKLFGDTNNKYKERVRNKLIEELPGWLDETKAESRSMNWYFGRYYTDNFQLRSLAGCAHGSCLASKNLTREENSTLIKGLQDYLNISGTKRSGACTMYFNEKVKIVEPCRSHGKSNRGRFKDLCPSGCDTPCRYPVSAWGPLGNDDLSHAIQALDAYDAIFLTETLDNDDQAAFLADIMGVPQNATFSLRSKNTKTVKSSEREKTHFYRDLLLNLTLNELYDRIHEENDLEIKLFDYAVNRNTEMVEQWREETGWMQ